MSFHGLTEQQERIIKRVLRPYAPQIDSVELFGSRAKGTAKPASDIDMVIFGKMTESDLARLANDFQESELSINVDLQLYHLITYAPLKQHIDEVRRVLYTKQQLLY